MWAARDAVLGRRVALKLLHRHLLHDANIAARFRQEAQAMAQLNHPHVVTVHDFVGEEGHWAIVMELIEHGETLGSVLKRETRIDPQRAARFVMQAASGLGHAHARNIVHRDVKPANVVVVRDGAHETAKVTDFGVARILGGERRTQAQLTLGTLWYIAPEQAQNSSVDARADVYSLGATLYEALTGQVVFPYDNAARVLAAHITEAPVPPRGLVPEIPEALEQLTLRMLAKDPSHRPADGLEVRDLLRSIIEQHWGSTHPMAVTPGPRSHPPYSPSHTPPSQPGAQPAAPTAPAPLSQDTAPKKTASTRSLEARNKDTNLGIYIGLGSLALMVGVCLLGTFLCMVSWFLR